MTSAWLSWSLRFVVVAFAASGALVVACSDQKVSAPASDKNFDDPDEPATPGQVGAVDATTADVLVACATDIDCPPRVARCMFRLNDGCGSVGVCLNYVEPTGCPKTRFCDCQGGGLSACAPDGWSPIPVNHNVTCALPDASSDDSSAATDAAGASDAPADGG